LQRHHEQAAEAYRQAVKLNPKLADAYLNLASLYQQYEDFEQAEQVLRQAVEAVPNSPEACGSLAQLREEQQDWNEAIHLYRRVVELQAGGDWRRCL
jgi:cytochrome c-type biogenesis protein CcmH/NrfG